MANAYKYRPQYTQNTLGAGSDEEQPAESAPLDNLDTEELCDPTVEPPASEPKKP